MLSFSANSTEKSLRTSVRFASIKTICTTMSHVFLEHNKRNDEANNGLIPTLILARRVNHAP